MAHAIDDAAACSCTPCYYHGDLAALAELLRKEAEGYRQDAQTAHREVEALHAEVERLRGVLVVIRTAPELAVEYADAALGVDHNRA